MNTSIKTIDFKSAKEILENDSTAVLLDVREDSEYFVSHAEGAKLLPVDTINEQSAKEAVPILTSPVIVYCKTGTRAALAAQRLAELGYSNVFNLGSLVGWPYEMSFGAW